MCIYKILEWDSDFFGFKVARIVPDSLLLPELENTLRTLKQVNVLLAYWASNPDSSASQEAARCCDGVLADKKVTFVMNVCNLRARSLPQLSSLVVEEFIDNFPAPEMEDLAIQAGVYSRFKVDSRIPAERFVDLYKLWIQNSVNKKIADAVFVARSSGRIVGMVTVGQKDGRADVGLIAVDTSMRRRGVGVVLVQAVQAWALSKGLAAVQVVTQADNMSACMLYESCGFYADKIENIYHFWVQQ